MSIANALLEDYEADIASLTLVPSDGGRFEVVVNDDLIYSKLRTGQHTDANQIVNLMRSKKLI